MIEGDELYTRVHKNMAPDESQGWTIVLMDRATRFLWDMHCGRKERKMFKKAMGLLCEVIQQTGDLTLLTDGERRYGSLLFELCSQALHNGKRGRPRKTLPKGVKVRLKNKGSQRHKRGRKRPKYQARHWFRLLQSNLYSAFKQLFESRISHGERSPPPELLKPLQELDGS